MLLRQFKRPLTVFHVHLNDAEAARLAVEMAQRAPLSEQAQRVRDALIEVVAESERALAMWNRTFEQSMETTMDAIPGWESTADFLEIANEKSNAELRIAAASPLVMALGDLRYAQHVLYLAEKGDPDELEPVVAARTLTLVSGVDASTADGLANVRAWLAERR